MVIWINGAFGAGKTSIARRIAVLRPDALLFDPEQIGFLLRRLLPLEGIADFQDRPLWRALTVRLITEAEATAIGPVIVPMTLVNRGYFDEVVGGLRRSGVALHHFTLTASPAILRRRLRRRLAWPASRRWALARVEPCAAALADPIFAVQVDTEGRKVAEIAADILARAGA
jgi:chloramphenicol 3-O-phosphotransferase